MNRKVLLGSAFAILFIASLVFGATQTAYAAAAKPTLNLYGTVTKDIIDTSNIMQYVDESGNNATLSYQIDTSKNITVPVGQIYFEKMFENTSIADITNAYVDSNWQYLVDANGIPYILAYISNTSSTQNGYSHLLQTIDVTFSDAYIVIAGKLLLQNIV